MRKPNTKSKNLDDRTPPGSTALYILRNHIKKSNKNASVELKKLADSIKAPYLDTSAILELELLIVNAQSVLKRKRIKDVSNAALYLDKQISNDYSFYGISERLEINKKPVFVLSNVYDINISWFYSFHDFLHHPFSIFRLLLQSWRFLYTHVNLRFLYETGTLEYHMEYLKDTMLNAKGEFDNREAEKEWMREKREMIKVMKRSKKDSKTLKKLMSCIDTDLEDFENEAFSDTDLGRYLYCILFMLYSRFVITDYYDITGNYDESIPFEQVAFMMPEITSDVSNLFEEDLNSRDKFAILSEYEGYQNNNLVITNRSKLLKQNIDALYYASCFDYHTLTFLNDQTKQRVKSFKACTLEDFINIRESEWCCLHRSNGSEIRANDPFVATHYPRR